MSFFKRLKDELKEMLHDDDDKDKQKQATQKMDRKRLSFLQVENDNHS
jgi:hypothetical protein